jgi:hypothetical protein
LGGDEFWTLDSAFDSSRDATEKPPRRGAAKKGTAAKSAPSAQPFLPGLSRRGRPRKKDADSPATRALRSRKQRIESGGQRVELVIDRPTADALGLLMAQSGESRAALLSRLILRAAKRIKTAAR